MLDVSDLHKTLHSKVSSFISPSVHLQIPLCDRVTCVSNMKLCEPKNPYVFPKRATFHQIVAVCIGLYPVSLKCSLTCGIFGDFGISTTV